jgi:hypothetical protein
MGAGDAENIAIATHTARGYIRLRHRWIQTWNK